MQATKSHPRSTVNPSQPTSLFANTGSAEAKNAGFSIWAQALIWLLLVVAGLLLVGFTAVVNDITERGELRRLQQRSSGSLLLPKEQKAGAVDAARRISMTSERPMGR
jgi:hypothetical protein